VNVSQTCAEEYDSFRGYSVGLDLGQAKDFTAISVIEERERVRRSDRDGDKREVQLLLRHIQRVPLNTPYDRIGEMIVEMVRQLSTDGRTPEVIADATGVGRPVIDLMRRGGLSPIAVTITGGKEEVSGGDFRYAIPKRNLVSALIIAFQTGALKIAADLPEIELLRTELVNFKAKITASGNETFEAWRESIHDDLVLSTALAVWWASKNRYRGPRQFRLDLMDR
jgi:hypothetical protein